MSSQLTMQLPGIGLSFSPLLDWIGSAPPAALLIRVATDTTVCCHHGDRLQTITSLMLTDLAPARLVLLRSIPVSVQQDDGAYLASFEDANVNASGETLNDALDMLKEMIVFTYDLVSDKKAVLGIGPQKQLAALRRFVRT